MDQALLKRERLPDGRELEYWAYGGDYGDTPNDAQVGGHGAHVGACVARLEAASRCMWLLKRQAGCWKLMQRAG